MAALVVVVLNSTKLKAHDTRIKTDLSQIRKVSEIWINDHGSNDGLCSSPDYQILAADIKANGGSEIPDCGADNQSYAVSSTLNNGKPWCVDSGNYFDEGQAVGTDCVVLAESPNSPSTLSYWYTIQGNIELTNAQIDFLVTHFNYVMIKGYLSKEKVAALKNAALGKNPNFKVFKYTNGMFSLAYKPPNDSVAYAHNQSSTETYKRIAETQYNEGWYLMDLCRSAWRDYFSQKAKEEIDAYGLDGIFVDDMGIASGIQSVTRIDFKPEKTSGVQYTNLEWYQCGGQFLSQAKSQLGSSKVVFNGLYHNPPYFDREYLGFTDGGLREGWILRDFVNFLDENLWKILLDSSIKDLNQYGSSFFPACVITNENATVNDALYCYASFLLVNKTGKVHYIAPTGPSGGTSLYYRPELSIDIGSPLEEGSDLEYYRSPIDSNLYERDYTGGKVIVNPTTKNISYSLDKEYYLVIPSGSGLVAKDGTVDSHLDYQKISEVNIAPQTGVILLVK